MAKGVIKFCYTKVIDVNSTNQWDKLVFEDTYREYFLQAQQFDQEKKYTTFQEVLKNIPKAEGMHYLVSTAAFGYLKQLNKQIPDVKNVQGKLCLPFKNFRFEILDSHISDKKHHKVAIYFYSEEITWIDSVGDRLIISLGDCQERLEKGQDVETDMLTMPANLSICSFRMVKVSNL